MSSILYLWAVNELSHILLVWRSFRGCCQCLYRENGEKKKEGRTKERQTRGCSRSQMGVFDYCKLGLVCSYLYFILCSVLYLFWLWTALVMKTTLSGSLQCLVIFVDCIILNSCPWRLLWFTSLFYWMSVDLVCIWIWILCHYLLACRSLLIWGIALQLRHRFVGS